MVREISNDDLGDIHFGRYITAYWWNGKDDFGDALANGVYLYRVIVKINNEDVDDRESGTGYYFPHLISKCI